MFIKKLLRRIGSSVLFWRIRHLIQPSWLDSYEQKDSTHILGIVKKLKCKAVLDFGCASGKTLEDIKDLSPEEMYVYGIDINGGAIKFCNTKFNNKYSSGFEFQENIDLGKIQIFLKAIERKEFDLIIFDRVLYCLNHAEIKNIFTKFKNIAKYILIDDFYDDKGKSFEYKHRDWIKVLSNFNYINIEFSQTYHTKVKNAKPKTMIFKSIKKLNS